mmetsp:Transcript_113419/g.159077  ORF Transcript_113419/g.159077 Transcript_113419/m.159077 type:complete len:228 (+) Transcript_113419:1437-2120(+)
MTATAPSSRPRTSCLWVTSPTWVSPASSPGRDRSAEEPTLPTLATASRTSSQSSAPPLASLLQLSSTTTASAAPLPTSPPASLARTPSLSSASPPHSLPSSSVRTCASSTPSSSSSVSWRSSPPSPVRWTSTSRRLSPFVATTSTARTSTRATASCVCLETSIPWLPLSFSELTACTSSSAPSPRSIPWAATTCASTGTVSSRETTASRATRSLSSSRRRPSSSPTL